MNDDQPRSVLDRVSKWLGRKKDNPELNRIEERGVMPEKREETGKEHPPAGAAKAVTPTRPAGGKPEKRGPEKPAGQEEAAKPGRALSASARRRSQRARAKERAARAAKPETETAAVTLSASTTEEVAPPPAPEPEKSGAKAEEGAPAPKTKPKRRPAARSKGAARKTDDTKAVPQAGKPDAEEQEQTEPGLEAAPAKAKPKTRAKTKAKPTRTRTRSKESVQETGETDEETTPAARPSAGYKLLINTDEPEECRLALLENGKVEGFFFESVSRAQIKGNIYKGRITSVEANLQAAFVDIGLPRNGFLSFSEIHPEYYSQEVDPETHWKNLKIQDLVKKGQEVLVEVVKESTTTKGPSLTTYLSLPGRCLVLMPGSDSAGISRKIDDEEQRRKLREMVEGLNIPEGIGYIIRTASQEITKTSLSQDLRYLLNLWEEIKKNGQTMSAPALVFKEQNIISRFLRDHYTTDIREILVDDEEAADQVRDFLQLLPATQRKKTTVKLHHGSQPIFHQYHVEKQIEQMFQPTVPLPSGGSIVINPTEALVAIDVNSGRTSSKDKDFEESIFIANLEAAEELARQLRMRDLGGLIVVDFIDMRSAAHTREVEKKVRECMKRDKAKVDFSKISKFGLMQISRQKMAAPLQTTSYKTCPHCEGRGMIRSVENLALSHLRQIQTGMSRRQAKKVLCRLPMEVAQYILNKKREELLELEKEYQAEITIEADPIMLPAGSVIDFIRE